GAGCAAAVAAWASCRGGFLLERGGDPAPERVGGVVELLHGELIGAAMAAGLVLAIEPGEQRTVIVDAHGAELGELLPLSAQQRVAHSAGVAIAGGKLEAFPRAHRLEPFGDLVGLGRRQKSEARLARLTLDERVQGGVAAIDGAEIG